MQFRSPGIVGGRSKVMYMMLVQKNTLSHCILVFMYSETCLIRTLCSKVTAGPTCESSDVLPQGCDEFSGPQILYYLKSVMNFQFPKSVIYLNSDRFLAVLYLMPACRFHRYRVLGHSMRFSY